MRAQRIVRRRRRREQDDVTALDGRGLVYQNGRSIWRALTRCRARPASLSRSVPSPPRMLRLARVTLREIQLALKEPFRISSGVVSARRILLLELEDESGARTWAECVAFERPNYTPETIDTAWL